MKDLDIEAWEMWLEYRKAIKKPLHEASFPLAQKKMISLGDRQMEAVEHSIANGYQGLFAPKQSSRIISVKSEDIPWQ